MLNPDQKFMRAALKQARHALAKKEVPIGAVIVKDGKVIARGYNQREMKQDASSHAEMTAIKKACKKLGSWRLIGCQLYVTLEPCAMCAGAIVLARIERVIFGAFDQKAGACGTVMNILDQPKLNHHPTITSGILEEECSAMLSGFFQDLRTAEKNKKKSTYLV